MSIALDLDIDRAIRIAPRIGSITLIRRIHPIRGTIAEGITTTNGGMTEPTRIDGN